MSKTEDAKDILKQFGLPTAQQNEIACLTLLALASLTEDRPWHKASKPALRIHEMLAFMNDVYKKGYAENTRENVRRQVIHQFEQARLVDRNPKDPTLATNSPRTHYALTDEALKVIRSFKGVHWRARLTSFFSKQKRLSETYRHQRRLQEIPLRTSTGLEIRLSPGKHNALQVAVVSHFGPKFLPQATLLYLGDAANKLLYREEDQLQRLRVPVTEHDKLPDVVLYDKSLNLLALIEAVTSHGPVSPKRFAELEASLEDCSAKRVYVTAFPSLREFKRHVDNIAWETEVWIAEIPDHLIHFNGDRLLSR